MSHENLDRVIALAGIYQAVNCVMRIARNGATDTDAMTPCIHALFEVDPKTVDAVFGEPGAVVNGARQIVAQITGQPERTLEMTRYVVQVIKLERSLSRRPDMLARISQGIEQAVLKREHFALLHPNLIAHFAEVYSSVLSQLSPRIMIRGESLHLSNPDNQNRVRALLLAAVRAAMLWRQVGGTRLQILFKNRQIIEAARHYIDTHAV